MRTPHVHVHSHMPHIRKVKVRARGRRVHVRVPKAHAGPRERESLPPIHGTLGAVAGHELMDHEAVHDDVSGDEIAMETDVPTLGSAGRRGRGRR